MKNRSVVEIIVIMLTIVVGFVIMTMSSAIMIIEIRDPETDTSLITATLTSLVSAILGALFGMMIRGNEKISRRPDDKEDDK